MTTSPESTTAASASATVGDPAFAASLAEIVRLSRDVGDPANDLVILAEGNTSVRTSGGRMLVKASGANLATAVDDDFVEVELEALMHLVRDGSGDDADVAAGLAAATTWGTKRPSVESLLHAVCQSIPAVTTVIHTHPTPVNALLCSRQAEALVAGSLFPDQIVVLGRHQLLVPYVDPGLPLAHHVLTEIERFTAENGTHPRVVYLRNHGMFALGTRSDEAVQITAMAVKSARVLLGALSAGGPVYLDQANADRIDTRPDELLRRRLLAEAADGSTPADH